MSILFHFTLILLKLEHASYHCRFTQSKPDKKVMLLYKRIVSLGVANEYLSRVLNAVITNKIVMMKITQPKRPFSTFTELQ